MTQPAEQTGSSAGSGASRQGGVLRGAHITLLGSGVGGLLAVVNEIVCARYLGVNQYGLYAFALICARIAEGISTLGMPVGALHFIAIHREQRQHRLVLGTIVAAVLPPLLIGGLAGAFLWSLAPMLAAQVFGGSAAVPFVRAMAVAIPFMGLSEVLGVVARGLGFAAYHVLVRSLVPPLVFLLMLMLILWQKGDPQAVPWAFCVAYVVAVLAGVLAVWRAGGQALFKLRPETQLGALYGYCLPVLANQLMYLVVACTPIVLLGILQTDKDVGVFRASMQFVIPFDLVVGAFNAAAASHYAVLEHQRRRAEVAALVERITGYMSPLAMAWLLFLCFNRHDIMALMGSTFTDGAATLLMLALGHALLCSVGTAGYLLVMSGRQRYETINAAAAAVSCIALNLLLIPRFGSFGAAAATALACLLVCALRILQVWRLMDLQILKPSLARVVGVAVVSAFILELLTRGLPIGQGSGVGGVVSRNILLVGIALGLYARFCMGPEQRRRFSQLRKR